MECWKLTMLSSLLVSTPALSDTELRRDYSAKDLGRMQSLNPEYFQRTAIIMDDQLEPIATIETSKGFSSHGRFTDRVRSDNFFRAFIDKSSGAVRFQLYEDVRYNYSWRNFASASVLLGGRPVSLQLTTIAHNVEACFSGVCSYRESVGIGLDEAAMREIASTNPAGGFRLWPFRLKAQSGMDFEDAVIPAEAAGLLAAVEAFRQRTGTMAPSRPAP